MLGGDALAAPADPVGWVKVGWVKVSESVHFISCLALMNDRMTCATTLLEKCGRGVVSGSSDG